MDGNSILLVSITFTERTEVHCVYSAFDRTMNRRNGITPNSEWTYPVGKVFGVLGKGKIVYFWELVCYVFCYSSTATRTPRIVQTCLAPKECH